MVAYAQQSDVYTYALPRGAVGNPGRLVESSLAATSTITLFEHSFAQNDQVTFRAAAGGVLSPPLVAGTVYYVIYLTDSTFQVASAPNGAAITLTGDGSEMFVTKDLPWAALCEFYSRWADGYLPAHAVPLQAPYPVEVVGVVAMLVGARVQILSGLTSVSMKDVEASAKEQLKRFATGIPVRGAQAANVPANLAVTVPPTPPYIGRPISQVTTTPSIADFTTTDADLTGPGGGLDLP